MFDSKQFYKNLLKHMLTAGALTAMLFVSACGDDDGGGDPPPGPDPGIDVEALLAESVVDFEDPSVLNLVGVTSTTNGLGTGYIFDESAADPTCGVESSYIGAPDLGAIWADGFSVAAWVSFSENRKFERIIDFAKEIEDNTNIGENGALNVTLSRLDETNDLALTSWIDSDGVLNKSTGRLIAEDVIVNGTTQFIVATITPAGVMTLSVDGQQVATKADGHPVINEARQSNFIGRSNYCFLDEDFMGTMSAIYVFNDVLTDEEIQALYDYGEENL